VQRESGKLRGRSFVRTRFEATAREFRTDVRMTIFSAGGTFSEFQLRLPPGAAMTEENPRWLTVERGADGRDLVKVKHEPTSRYSLALSLVHPHDPGGKPPVELGKYEVLGAVRQWGYLSLEVEDNHQARWGTLDPQHVSRIAVADLPREFLEDMKLVPSDADAAFELFSAQSSLTVACARARPRVRVEPDQVVFVEGDRLRLEALLRYTTDRPISQVQFELPPGDDWQDVKVDSTPTQMVQQPVTVDSAPAGRGPTGRKLVTVDLKSGAGNSFTLRVSATKKLATEQGKAEPGNITFGVLQIPGQSASGRLWVQPADEVSLTPVAGSSATGAEKDKAKAAEKKTDREIVALSPLEPAPSLPEGVDRQGYKQPATCYRVESFGATFAGRLGSHPQRLSLASETDVSVEAVSAEAARVRVQQRLRADLENRPLSELTLDVPPELDGLQVDLTVDGKTLRGLALLSDRATATAPADPRRKHLQFASPLRPGKFVLQLSYQQPWAPESQRGPGRQRVVVPLVTPLSGTWRQGSLSLTAKDGFSARLAGASAETWRALAEDSSAGPDAPQRFQATQPASEAVLEVLWGAAVVHRLWLDSWLSPDKRIDRLVCNFTSDRHPLRIQLPPGAAGSLQAVLDGKPLRQAAADDQDIFEVAPSAASRTLELRYEVLAGPGGLTAQLDPARPTDEAWVRETYWRLVLPERRYLLWSPGDVQREFSWQWSKWGWGRTSRRMPDEAAGGDLALPEGVNAYLFSTLGPPPAIRVASADIFWLVFVASGLAFVAGALVLTVPGLRRREVLLGVAGLLVVVALLYPEPFLLVAQAASLGVAAVVLFLALKLLVAASRPFVTRGAGGSTLAPSGVFRGSSAPTRLTPNRAATSGGSSRAATVSSQQTPAAKAGPVVAVEVASAGSNRASPVPTNSQGT
jgi:hypothetical protein